MSAYSLEACLINFTLVPDRVRIIDHYPELSAYPEFVNATDKEIKVAIALADINSPFVKIRDYSMRLKALFEFLGLGMKGPMKDFHDRVLNYTDPVVFPICSRYIQMINNHDYASWWSLNIAFYHLQRESIMPMKHGSDAKKFANESSALSNEMDKISVKLKNYEARLFGDVAMKQKMVEAELKKMSFFPEKMAEEFPGFETGE